MELTDLTREVSAFINPNGLFECKVMPFGMRNAAATFQRLMSFVLQGIEGCTAYIDDIVIFSQT